MFSQIFAKTKLFFIRIPSLVIILLLSIIILYLGFYLFFSNKIYPGVYIAGTEVGGLTKAEAQKKLENIQNPQGFLFVLEGKEYKFDNFEIDYLSQESVDLSFKFGRDKDLVDNLQNIFLSLHRGVNLPASYKANADAISEALEIFSKEYDKQYQESEVAIQKGKVVVLQGHEGQEVDRKLLLKNLAHEIAYTRSGRVYIPLVKLAPKLSQEDVSSLEAAANKVVGKSLK